MSVQLEKDFFKKDEIETIFKYIFRREHERSWSIQKHFWQDSLQNKSPGVVAVFNIKDEVEEMIKNKLQKYLNPGETVMSVQYYEWNQMSQINWHDDSHVYGAVTIYLNENWDNDWGGLFCWKEKKTDTPVGNFLFPMFNMAIILRNHIPHHVSLINPYAPVRKTLQIWIGDAQAAPALPPPLLEPVLEEP